MIEGIEEDVPSIDPTIDVTEALDIAVRTEGDFLNDVNFDPDVDAQLVIYVQVLDPIFEVQVGPVT